MSGWTSAEKQLITAATALAPSVHNTRPWVLEFHDEHISLYERLDRALPHHDPVGRDRLISCGAALEHVLLAARFLGRVVDIDPRHDRAHPDEVVRVTATGRAEPSDGDRRRYRAISARRSHRGEFAARPVERDLRRELLGGHDVDGVGLRPVTEPGEVAVLARLLNHSALVLRADRAYQRELAAWTAPVRDPSPGAGVSSATRRVATLPWAGLVRPTTAIPDVGFLADRLSRELLLLVQTPDDGRYDHVRAGMAAERTWLTATDAGLVGSVLTQPCQLHEVRAGLVESLSLAGFPQLLLRLGHP
ncbi:Acg family FMN-binding oxidoreductase [Actinophytocola sp.]|uniref:Acg family FMN-binding oxidoreductase n=1 Tax=Actinophytocola sp. TaxID=1872138 RepID=UPI00389B01CF